MYEGSTIVVCSEINNIHEDDMYLSMNQLSKVSGIGPSKARDLVKNGIKSINDLKQNTDKLNHHQQIGLKYFEDLQLRIPKSEVNAIEDVIKKEILLLDGNYQITICGSYRRGKETSGDIDCLITHPDITSHQDQKGKKSAVLKNIVNQLSHSGLIIETMALGELKFMGVCRLSEDKPARRLDIRLTYYDQYHCCVLYFTGSDLFNRNMRAHAHEKGFTLNEYSLRPIGITGVLGEPVPITTEEEIFEYIDYPYKKPCERNI